MEREYQIKEVKLNRAFKIYTDYDIEEDMKYPYHLTPYEGCVFRCVYCFNNVNSKYWIHLNVRSNTEIAVAMNIVEIIQKELPLISRISNLPLIVRIGTEAEVYGPPETTYRIMPEILKEFLKYPKWQIRIPTKSDLILRDIEIIKKLNVLVTLTLVTTNDEVAKKLEPYAPLPSKRIEALAILREQGVKCRIRCEPYLPGISDVDNMMKIRKKLNLKEVKIKPLNYYTEEEILKYLN